MANEQPKNVTLPARLRPVVDHAISHIAASTTEAEVLYRETYCLGMVDGANHVANLSQGAFQRARDLVRECAVATKRALRAGSPSPTSGHAR